MLLSVDYERKLANILNSVSFRKAKRMIKLFDVKMLAVLLFASAFGLAHAQDDTETSHISVDNPAELSQAEANEIYDELRKRMGESFALAELEAIDEYQSWTRYNSAPYLSATHGRRFVNNFANSIASDYGKLAKGEKYPEGSVFAKDSMTVIDDNQIYPGAMFVMEKLAEGTSPETADWRYVMVLPDGSTLGDTTGNNPKQVRYCHACHVQKASDDFVFFVPDDYRLEE